MLNLLKFKERAEYADGRETTLTGQQAYMIYGAAVAPMVARGGGQFAFSGATNALVIGDGELEWDQVSMVSYPSLEAFEQLLASTAYREIQVHREAGLERQLLIHCLAPGQQPGTARG